MIFFKKVFVIVILCNMHCITAKRTGIKATTPSAPIQPSFAKPSFYTEATKNKPESRQPAAKPTVQQPQPQIQPIPSRPAIKTFQQLVAHVKNSPTHSVWDNTKKILQQTFVNNLIKDAVAARLRRTQINALLIIARDTHAQFTGNTNTDTTILKNLETQRENALNKL